MKLDDLALGLLLVAASVGIWISAQGFSRLPNQAYGSETMPLALAALALGLGLFLAVQGLRAGGRWPAVARADWTRAPGAVAAVAAALALVVGYILLSDRIGFLPTAFAVILALMLVMRVRPLLALPLSVLAAVAIQQAFGRLLLVPLPRSGFLGFLW